MPGLRACARIIPERDLRSLLRLCIHLCARSRFRLCSRRLRPFLHLYSPLRPCIHLCARSHFRPCSSLRWQQVRQRRRLRQKVRACFLRRRQK